MPGELVSHIANIPKEPEKWLTLFYIMLRMLCRKVDQDKSHLSLHISIFKLSFLSVVRSMPPCRRLKVRLRKYDITQTKYTLKVQYHFVSEHPTCGDLLVLQVWKLITSLFYLFMRYISLRTSFSFFDELRNQRSLAKCEQLSVWGRYI